MVDPELERRFTDCQDLLTLWKNFREFMLLAAKIEEITPEREAQFLQVKSEIAIRHDSFMDSLPSNMGQAGQVVLDIIIRCITLKHVNRMAVADQRKLDQEWHDSFILITETIEHVSEERTKLAAITAFAANMASIKKKFSIVVQKIMGSGYLKMAILLIIVTGVLAGFDMFMQEYRKDWESNRIMGVWYKISTPIRKAIGAE